MQQILAILKSKPLPQVYLSGILLILMALVRWRFAFAVDSVFFVAGGLLGIYFLNAAEQVMGGERSPFRTVVFAVLFAVTAFFVTTSSTGFFARGLVVTMFLDILADMRSDLKRYGNLDSWFSAVSQPVTPNVQTWMFRILCAAFLVDVFLSVV